MIVVVAPLGPSGAGAEENGPAEPSVSQFSAWLDVFNSGDRERYAEFLAGSFPARPAEFPIARLTEGEAVAGVQAMLREDAAADRFSGAVLVAKNGQALFSRAYGLADREQGIPNTLQTRFRIGSMNKMFTAVATLQLAEAGKVELTAPLGAYLTGYPNRDAA